ncbi:hypothetical protein BbINS_06132 [Bartonella bacilliformis INS]|uniref:Uncharacterized protein n=2 Tax=Bartonella bacilliformis TaxID=774 RepID=A1UU93_BARBK|nr:hypothetical protein BARBAKC583_1297 [Bartonella bacilliformis KC583]EKS43178.1 hypothetical protein BbINS_06132 [Bartonella bacilliformis INS]
MLKNAEIFEEIISFINGLGLSGMKNIVSISKFQLCKQQEGYGILRV